MKFSWSTIFTFAVAPLVALYFLAFVVILPFMIWDGFTTGDVFYMRFHATYLPVMAFLAACTIGMIVGLAKRKIWGLLLLLFVSGVWIFKSVTDIILAEFNTRTMLIEAVIICLILANLVYFYLKRGMFGISRNPNQ